MVKKKLNLKNQGILLVEAFLVYNSKTMMFPDMPFLQNDGPEQYLKNQFPETANDKSFAKNLENSLGHYSNSAGNQECC